MARMMHQGVCSVLALFLLVTTGFSQKVQTSVLYDQLQVAVIPYLHSDKVVFQDHDQGSYRFFLLDVTTKSRTEIRNNGAMTYLHPADFGGTHIAWIGYASTFGGLLKQAGPGLPIPGPSTDRGYFIRVRNVGSGSESKITTDTLYKEFLAIDGNRVVWTDYRHFAPGDTTVELYAYDLSSGTERRVTTRKSYKAHPHIRGNRVVWQDYRNAGTNRNNADIYLYDFSTNTETAICTHAAYQDQPHVYGNLVVWQDFRNAGSNPKNADIYLYDMSTNSEKAICTAPGYQAHPRVYGDIVVWHDYRNAGADTTNVDIYGFDLKTNTEFVVTTKSGYQAEPHLYGNKIVWLDYTDRYLYLGLVGSASTVRNAQVASESRSTKTAGILYPDRCPKISANPVFSPLGRKVQNSPVRATVWGWRYWGMTD